MDKKQRKQLDNDEYLKGFDAAHRQAMRLFPPVIRSYKDKILVNYVDEAKALDEIFKSLRMRYIDQHYPWANEDVLYSSR